MWFRRGRLVLVVGVNCYRSLRSFINITLFCRQLFNSGCYMIPVSPYVTIVIVLCVGCPHWYKSSHCVLLYTYMHTCMHTCIHSRMYTCIHAYMHTCMHANILYIHAYMHACMRLLYACPCVCACLCTTQVVYVFMFERALVRVSKRTMYVSVSACLKFGAIIVFTQTCSARTFTHLYHV